MTSQPTGQAASGTADLFGYGRLTWTDFLTILGGAHAAWADYEGFHIQPAPPAPPPYTHLWAWTSQWLIRARADGDAAITGALALSAEPQAVPPPKLHERVSYQRVQTSTWPPGEQRVGPLEPHITGRQVTLYLVSGTRPVTFIDVSPTA